MKRLLRKIGVLATGGPPLRSVGRDILLAAVVGMVAGLGAIAFHWLCLTVEHYGLDMIGGYHAGSPAGDREVFERFGGAYRPWLMLVVITAGGLISGWLVFQFAPEAEGHGTDAAIHAYHHRRGIVRGRVPIIKMFASAITLGTGGSGGREGPIAQIGAGFGSFLATRLKLSDADRRTLLAAGVGAGIGAIFRAPLAGAIFAIEVLYRDPEFEAEALIPAFVSTTMAYCVFCFTFGFEPLFTVPPMRFDNPLLLGPLTVLAVAMVVASYLYVRTFYGVHDLFRRLKMPRRLKPAVGALATGLLAIALYYSLAALGPQARHDSQSVLSFGYGFLQRILTHQGAVATSVAAAVTVLLLVGIGKIVTTALTIGSGGSGGVFGPSMVIGGSLGAVVGLAFQQWMPSVVTRVDMFVILGMASFFAAAANTPVSTLIIVSEMTASYLLLLPAMWVCALAYMLSRGWSIYREQVASRVDSPAHRGDFVIDVLEGLAVHDVWSSAFTPVRHDANLRQVVRIISGTGHSCFPIVDEQGEYCGFFSLNDLGQLLYDPQVADVATAGDLIVRDVEPLKLNTDLSLAMSRFAQVPYDELPIVSNTDPKSVVGMLRRQDIVAAYNARLVEMRR